MCNIAGYAGNRKAAPILLEMLKRQEYYDGNVSTGIATIHEGKLHYRKRVGDVDNLIKTAMCWICPHLQNAVCAQRKCSVF